MSGTPETPPAVTAKFYHMSRDGADLRATASEKAPVPMDPKAVKFLGRLSADDDLVQDDKVCVDAARRASYAAQILSYGQTGLEHGDLDTANTALDWFERRVTDTEGPEIRKRHILATLRLAAFIGIPAALVGLWLDHNIPTMKDDWLVEVKLMRAALLLLTGNALGIVFFAFARNLDLKFDQLSKFDPANLEPALRFTLVWIITVIFAILLYPKVLIVALGSHELNDFFDDPLMAVIVGILSGYSDGAVSKLLAGVLNNPQSKGSPPP
jgi:hypothetical protein